MTLGSATQVGAGTPPRRGNDALLASQSIRVFYTKPSTTRVYLGEAVHKGTAYPGQHAAIIGQDLWDKVQSILKVSPRQRAAQTRKRPRY